MPANKTNYAASGVDIDAGNKAVELMKQYVKSTYNKNVLAGVGSFGGMFSLPKGYKEPILVSSADGVGTKLKLAFLSGKHDTIGQDLVNHCVNDILVQGAKPLYFFDYYGTGRLVPETAAEVVKGLSVACKENGCVLLGGETAEMPGMYEEGEYDLAGFIVGIVEKNKVITGEKIKKGDVLIGLGSSGLHTNGFSLARKVLDVRKHMKELLAVHTSYLTPVSDVMDSVKGMAHITGGGLIENIPRILPKNVSVAIKKDSWQMPHIFKELERYVDEDEMYHVFNMGIGMVLFVDAKDVEKMMKKLSKHKTKAFVIGEAIVGNRDVKFV